MYGGFSVHDEWGNGGWSRIDAISIIVMRFYMVFFIISIILSILSIFFIKSAVEKIENK